MTLSLSSRSEWEQRGNSHYYRLANGEMLLRARNVPIVEAQTSPRMHRAAGGLDAEHVENSGRKFGGEVMDFWFQVFLAVMIFWGMLMWHEN